MPLRLLTPAVHAANALDAIRPSQVTVTAFERVWMLQGSTAHDWMGAILTDPESLAGVFPGMCADEDLEALLELSFTEDFSARCTNTARVAVGRGAGRDWWWALNLVNKIFSGFPHVNGVMRREGIAIKNIDFPDYLDAVYSLLWERGDEEGRLKLDLELQLLPKGVAIRQSGAAAKAMAEAFAKD